jgi:hypothetical protein
VKRLTIVGLLALAACGTPDTLPAAPADQPERINTHVWDFELPGPNLYFICDGHIGIYVTEGSNGDSGKSASPAVVLDHPRCREGGG